MLESEVKSQGGTVQNAPLDMRKCIYGCFFRFLFLMFRECLERAILLGLKYDWIDEGGIRIESIEK